MQFIFINNAEKQLDKSDKSVQKRISEKIEWYENQNNPIKYAKQLVGDFPLTHRFRIGKWRLKGIWFQSRDIFMVYEIEARGQTYKKKRR